MKLLEIMKAMKIKTWDLILTSSLHGKDFVIKLITVKFHT